MREKEDMAEVEDPGVICEDEDDDCGIDIDSDDDDDNYD